MFRIEKVSGQYIIMSRMLFLFQFRKTFICVPCMIFMQINQALKHASLKSYSLKSDGDGDQCLDLYLRDPIEVILELFSDSSASGKQYFVYEEYRSEDGKWEFYHTNGALWWQWAHAKAIEIGGPGTGVCSIVFSIDATFAKKNTYYRPSYGRSL